MNRLGWMIAFLCVSLVGCANSAESTGPSRSSDDAGVSRTPGPSPTPDPTPAATSDAGPSPASDDGVGAACEPDVIPAPTTAGCAASTRTCLDACEDEACFDNCLLMDPDADGCFYCLDDAYLACVNAAGCQAQWDAVSCCLDECGETEECYTTTCATESRAFEACADATDAACDGAGDVCFGG